MRHGWTPWCASSCCTNRD
jgi:hypothetical protein